MWIERFGSTRIPPQRLARLLLVVVVLSYAGLAVPGVVFYTDGWSRVWSLVLLAAVISLQLGYISRADRLPTAPTKYVVLVAYAALVVVQIELFGPLWREIPGMVAGNALLLLPAAAGVPLAILAIVVLAALQLARVLVDGDPPLATIAFLVQFSVTAGIAVFGMTTLVRLVVDAQAAREQVRRAAVARERVRFARELHDLLGQSLSAIALRGQLVARLMAEHSDQARAELADVLELARKALVDVRMVASVRRELNDSAQAVKLQVPATALRPRLGTALLTGVLLLTEIPLVIAVLEERGGWAAFGLSAVRLVAIGLVLHLVQSRHRIGPLQRWAELALLAVLVWVPIPFLGPYSHRGEALLVGGALIALPLASAVVVFVIGVGVSFAVEVLDPNATGYVVERTANAALSTVVLSLVIYGLATVTRLVAEMRAARDEVSVVAIAQERVRFSQDVHDLLGFSLSAVALKTELVGKLVGIQPERARLELTELLETTHQALADVRSVAGGEHDLSIDAESLSVESTLVTAGVRVGLTRAGSVPDGPVGTVLATVLREAATNVLRHSKAEWCDITISCRDGVAVLEVTNDGVGAGRIGDHSSGGSGLKNMTQRATALGGRLDTSVEDGVYKLYVQLPVQRVAQPSDRRGDALRRRVSRAA